MENRRLNTWLQEMGAAPERENKGCQPCVEFPGSSGRGWPHPIGDELSGLELGMPIFHVGCSALITFCPQLGPAIMSEKTYSEEKKQTNQEFRASQMSARIAA